MVNTVIEIFKNELYALSPTENDGISGLSQFYGNLKELGHFPEIVIIKDKIVHRKDLRLELFNENKIGFYLYGNAEDGTSIRISYVNDNIYNFGLMKQLIEILEKDIEKGDEIAKLKSEIRKNMFRVWKQ